VTCDWLISHPRTPTAYCNNSRIGASNFEVEHAIVFVSEKKLTHWNIYNIFNTVQQLYTPVFLKLSSMDHRLSACRFGRKKHAKNCIRHITNTNTPIQVCAETIFVGWPSTENWRINSFLSFNHYFRKHFKLVQRKNVVMVTLTTGIMFVLFTYMNFLCGEFYEGGPRVRWPPMSWSANAWSLRNTDRDNE
jgi:hypothetical protein